MLHSINGSLRSRLLGSALLVLPFASIAAAEETSIDNIINYARTHERVCFINCQDGKNPYVHIHDHLGGKNTSLKLAPSLATPQVLRYTMRGFGSHTKSDIKYAGGRKNQTMENVVKLLKTINAYPDRTYTGTLFIDEYSRNLPFVMLLESVEQLRAFANYFSTTMGRSNRAYTSKPVLVLDIKNDPTLATLNNDDQNFIETYFTAVSFQDPVINSFISTCWDRLKKENAKLEGSQPEFINEELSETLVRMFEKTCKELQPKQVAAAIIGATAALVAFKNIGSPAIDRFAKNISNFVTSTASSVCSTTKSVIPFVK